MENNTGLSVVLPAYHEADNLAVLLPRLNSVLGGLGVEYEIVVVDAFIPSDNTAEICNSNGARCVNRLNSDLFGDAVRTGIAEAKGTYVVFMDADGSHPPEFIPKLLEHKADYDVVVASRYVLGGSTENSRSLILMSRILNLIYSLVLNIRCADISNSFKLYKRAALVGLDLNCKNFDIVEEIIFKIVKINPNARIKEVPFNFEKRKFGETKRNLSTFIVSFVVTLFKLRFGVR